MSELSDPATSTTTSGCVARTISSRCASTLTEDVSSGSWVHTGVGSGFPGDRCRPPEQVVILTGTGDAFAGPRPAGPATHTGWDVFLTHRLDGEQRPPPCAFLLPRQPVAAPSRRESCRSRRRRFRGRSCHRGLIVMAVQRASSARLPAEVPVHVEDTAGTPGPRPPVSPSHAGVARSAGPPCCSTLTRPDRDTDPRPLPQQPPKPDELVREPPEPPPATLCSCQQAWRSRG